MQCGAPAKFWWPRVPACAVALLAAGSLAGCGRCSDEPRVPFKLNPEATEQQAAEPSAVVEAGAASYVFPQAVDQPLLAGSRLALSHVRAALEVDLDGDGDRDALALTADDEEGARLLVSMREPTGLGAARDVPGFTAPNALGCAVASAALTALSKSKAALSLELTCSEPIPPAAPRNSFSLLSLEATPRVYERVDVLAASAGSLTLSPRSHDADGDGHDDFAFGVLASGAAEADSLSLIWLDRPSGLVRDLREPEATLSAWAAAAQSRVAKAPAQAIGRAELALSLQRAICRELGAPVIALSGTPGVPCGAMKSTGLLLATLVTAYAKTGDLRAAFEAYRQLRRVEPAPPSKVLEQAGAALQKLRAEPQVTLRQCTSVEPARTPRVHLPSARFVSESLLFVQRASPVLYDLEQSEENAAPSASDLLVRDPNGQLIATAIERSCEGYVVRIERAPPRGSDYVSTSLVATAVLAEAPSPPGCTPSTGVRPAGANAGRGDDGGYSLLGWAPQGLVAVRGSEVRMVPLGGDGRASEPPRQLAPDAPRPAPLPSGSATPDGARYVEATPYGVLVYGPASTRVELWRPEGYLAVAQGPLEAAISPSARRVAVVAGNQVYLLERAGP